MVCVITWIHNQLILSYKDLITNIPDVLRSPELCASCKLSAPASVRPPTQSGTSRQAPTHPRQNSEILSCCCDTKQQKQVSLVSVNCQRSSCWILALYDSWRECASCWQLGAMFIIAPLCCQKHDGFQAFILKDFFFFHSILTPSLFYGPAVLLPTQLLLHLFTIQVRSRVQWNETTEDDCERKMFCCQRSSRSSVIVSLCVSLYSSVNTDLNTWRYEDSALLVAQPWWRVTERRITETKISRWTGLESLKFSVVQCSSVGCSRSTLFSGRFQSCVSLENFLRAFITV